MGLFRIPIRPGKFEAIPGTVQSLGFAVVRIERQEDGVVYTCINPKKLNRYWKFRITNEQVGTTQVFTCGLSKISKRIVGHLNAEGLIGKDNEEMFPWP